MGSRRQAHMTQPTPRLSVDLTAPWKSCRPCVSADSPCGLVNRYTWAGMRVEETSPHGLSLRRDRYTLAGMEEPCVSADSPCGLVNRYTWDGMRVEETSPHGLSLRRDPWPYIIYMAM
nr:hypothetical protein Iba_chr13bCG4950 [Ipomoea batatas]